MSLTRSLTRPLTRKISRADLTQGFGGSFSPFALDPYLLFDARDSMVGTLENPTLDLNPALPETLEVITATRAGIATYTDPDGLIATASADTVRVDHVDGVPMILVEPSATNLVTYSEDFSHSSWLKNGVGTGVAPVVTLNAAESPDGTQNATKVVFDSGSGTTTDDVSTLEDFFNTTGGVSYTQSIYLKGENGGEKILLRNAGNSAYTTVTLTTDWARYEVTETANLNLGYFSMGLRQAVNGSINSQITVYAYGAQVESGSVSTSVIPTSGSPVTRAADDLVISGSAFSSFYNQSEGTFYLEAFHKEVLVDAAYLSGQGSNQYFMYRNRSDNNLNSFDGGSSETIANIPSDALFRAAVTYSTTNKTLSMNGTTSSEGSINSNWAAANILNIGQGSDGHIIGHIKRLIYWPYHSDSL